MTPDAVAPAGSARRIGRNKLLGGASVRPDDGQRRRGRVAAASPAPRALEIRPRTRRSLANASGGRQGTIEPLPHRKGPCVHRANSALGSHEADLYCVGALGRGSFHGHMARSRDRVSDDLDLAALYCQGNGLPMCRGVCRC